MKKQIECKWLEKLSFEAIADDHKILLDVEKDNGGTDIGPRPKTLLLVALAGCTGMDVVAILAKMKIRLESFRTIVEGDAAEEHPKSFTSMHIKYYFRGKDLEMEKLKKAVDLSQDRYCAVSGQFKKGIPVTYEIIIE